MLIIDGVRYEEWIPSSEDEFEQVVKEHAQDIFGEDSIYFDLKKKLKTRAGIGSIPDGYVLSLQEEPRWYICEIELHTHSLYEHIIAQLQKIITAAKTLQSQKVVTDAIYSEIKSAPFKEALIKGKIGTEDLHHFIANLIAKPPILVIPIDQKIDGLKEACDGLPIEEVRIVEFQTFTREEVGLAVHAHLFEPLYVPEVQKPDQEKLSAGDVIGFSSITQDNINRHYINIDMIIRSAFPSDKVRFTLETDVCKIETNVVGAGTSYGSYIQRNLKKWVNAHPELKTGDTVSFTVIEPMKRYRLEIEK